MPQKLCGGIYAGREGETFRFRITEGAAVCRGQLVIVDAATQQPVGQAMTYSDHELRTGISVPLQGGTKGQAYNLLLACAPAGADLSVELTIKHTFQQQCTVGPGGDIGPWIVGVPASDAIPSGQGQEEGGQ